MTNESKSKAGASWSEPNIIAYEFSVIVTSITIIVTSGLVVRHIQNKGRRLSRPNMLFMALSISDIGVGLITVPALGVHGMLDYKTKMSENKTTRFATVFFKTFPFNFSYIVTTVIAIDRLLVMTMSKRFENVITKKRLLFIILWLFTIAVASAYVDTHLNQKNHLFKIAAKRFGIFNVSLYSFGTIIIICAYIYLLHYVYRQDNKLRRHRHEKQNKIIQKTLSKTILCILTSQIICNLPNQILTAAHLIFDFDFQNRRQMICWLILLRTWQCICDGVFFLLKEKRIIRRRKRDSFTLTEVFTRSNARQFKAELASRHNEENQEIST